MKGNHSCKDHHIPPPLFFKSHVEHHHNLRPPQRQTARVTWNRFQIKTQQQQGISPHTKLNIKRNLLR